MQLVAATKIADRRTFVLRFFVSVQLKTFPFLCSEIDGERLLRLHTKT
jgi:hypothetical protein